MKAALAKGTTEAQASQFVVYPEAGHAFHADYRPSYVKSAADDGWVASWPGSSPTVSPRLAGRFLVEKPSNGRLFLFFYQSAMNLLAIIAATLVAGIGSVWIAALLLRVGVRRRRRQ